MSVEGRPPGEAGETSAAVRSAIALAGSVLGLAGYVYLTGGIVTWVSLTAARLPPDVSTAVIDNKLLFAVGFKAIVFIALLFLALCAIAYHTVSWGWDKKHKAKWAELIEHGAHGSDEAAGRSHERYESPWGKRVLRTVAGLNILVLAAIAGLVAANLIDAIFATPWLTLVGFFVALALVTTALGTIGPLVGRTRLHTSAAVLIVLAALLSSAPVGLLVLVSLAIAHFSRIIARLNRPASLAALVRSPLPWALLSVYALVALTFVAIPPAVFPRAVLTTASGDLAGGFLARTSDGVYLVTCRPLADASSIDPRSILVAASDIKRTQLGGAPYRLDSGDRPSLATLVLRIVGIHLDVPSVIRADIHPRHATCGADAAIAAGPSRAGLGAYTLTPSEPAGARASVGETPIQRTSPSIATLALKYQPTVEVTAVDRFWPVSVTSVLADRGTSAYARHHHGVRETCLVRNGRCGPSPPKLADLDPKGANATDYLDYPAPLSSDPAAQFEAFARGQNVPDRVLKNWLSGVRAVDPWQTAQVYFYDAGVIDYSARYHGAPPGLRGLQYWFFYPYNYYPTAVDAGLMAPDPVAADKANTDLHEGDWEHVTVLLDPKTDKPRYLYTARHDKEGQAVPWSSPTLTFDADHPIVQAALGGHPTYENTCEQHPRIIAADRLSDWVICAPGAERYAFRAATTPLVDLAKARWACWPGHFGEATPTQLAHAKRRESSLQRTIEKYYHVAGPLSPLRQAENSHACP